MSKHDCGYFYGRKIEIDIYGNQKEIKYCPLCGNLTEPQINRKPMTIKELRKQEGNPIWIECFKYPEVSAYYIAKKCKQTNRIECWGYDSNFFDEINYGKVWVAYKQKIDR